ncbi:uncharacterized protein JCM6883_000101 [Sporobolomyces salmoneus]|uniref:uncharacterized protein n=1 Tax=Sporobolomyces salmoneus TaxID=183962 RepID=UPI00317A306A
MQLPTSILLLIFSSAASLVQALPTPNRQIDQRDINISHKSLVNGTSTTHSIDASLLPAELAEAIAGSDININLTTDRRKRSPIPSSSGVNNSTINLTVISSRSISSSSDVSQSKRSKTTPQHHNIHIDASSNGQGGVGGIHNSTVNINLNSSSSKRKERRKVALGDHSVIVDLSSSSSTPEGEATGIEDSTVHVNILPPRALEKTTGHHSIVIDSSSTSSDDASSTKTGDHSAVVDTSSSSSSNNGTGIKGSTINLTVIAPSDSKKKEEEAKNDTVESPIPSMARLSKRSSPSSSSSDAFADWSAKVQRTSLEYQSETQALAAAAEADAGLSITRRDHSSHKI